MPENKTQKTTASVEAFLSAIPDEAKRRDARAIAALMTEETGEQPALWGAAIVGFGSYRYTYESGHSGEAPLTGFSPRKQNFALYIMPGFTEYGALLAKLGKHKTSKSCLYVNKLADVDVDVLRDLVRRAVAWMRKKYA